MFDEILDLFDRNRRERRNGSRPGLIGRMLGGDDHDDRRSYGYDPERRRDDDDDEHGDEGRTRRRRDSDFDFDD